MIEIRELPSAKILLWNPKLRDVECAIVDDFGKWLEDLVDYLTGTMYEHNGVGLAAPQIGVFKRVAVIQLIEDRTRPPFVMINPAIINSAGKTYLSEGCLSLPRGYANQRVPRAYTVKVAFQDISGKSQEMEVSGDMARAVQHEVDHLFGKFFIDHLSPLKRQMVVDKYHKSVRSKDEHELSLKYRKDFEGIDSSLVPSVDLPRKKSAMPALPILEEILR